MTEELFQPEAETALLSILLHNPEKFYELKNVNANVFSSSANSVLYNSIKDLLGQNLIPEVNLIYSYLKALNREAEVGGKDYLNYLYSQSYSEQNIREYEKSILTSYKARTLISAATKIPQAIMTTKNVDGILSETRQLLDRLMSDTTGEGVSNFLDVLKETFNEIVERTKNPGIRGISSGLKKVDTALGGGFNPTDLVIIAGRPSMGKSTVLSNLATNQVMENKPVLIFSREMDKVSITERIISSLSDVILTNIRLGLLNQKDIDKINETIIRLKQCPLYIDATSNTSLDYILTTTRKYVKMYGVKIVYIDYIQLVVERSTESTTDLGKASQALKLLAGDLGVTIVVLSQLNRLVEMRDDKHPILSDLRQSGNLEEDADVVIGIYRDEYYNKESKLKGKLEFIVLKNRNGDIGSVFLDFNRSINKITDGA